MTAIGLPVVVQTGAIPVLLETIPPKHATSDRIRDVSVVSRTLLIGFEDVGTI